MNFQEKTWAIVWTHDESEVYYYTKSKIVLLWAVIGDLGTTYPLLLL